MNYKEFISAIEGYYGPYASPIQKAMVSSFVERIPEPKLEPLLMCIFKEISTQYKSVPDIAAIIKVMNSGANEIKRLLGEAYEKEPGVYYIKDEYIGSIREGRFYPWIGDLEREQMTLVQTLEDAIGFRKRLLGIEGPEQLLRIEEVK